MFPFWSLLVFVRIKALFADLAVEYKSGTCCLLLVLQVVTSLLLHRVTPYSLLLRAGACEGLFFAGSCLEVEGFSLEDFELF